MAKHRCLSVTSGKERKCIFTLTIATTLLTPRDQEKRSEWSYERTQTHLLLTLCCLGKINKCRNKCQPGAWQFGAFSFYTFPRFSRGNCLGVPCNATEVGGNEWRDLVCPSYHVISRHIFYQPCTPSEL